MTSAEGGGGGGRGSELPASSTIYSRALTLLISWWFPPLCAIFIAKYYEMLQHFAQNFPVPTTLGIPLPAILSPASRSPPALYSPGAPAPLNGDTAYMHT